MSDGRPVAARAWQGTLLFWLSAGAIAYTWALYPLCVKVVALLRRPSTGHSCQELPTISVVMAVHNEEQVIAEALEDLLSLEYPPERLEFVVVSDGSTDRTEEVIRGCADPRVRLISIPRSGQTAAVTAGVLASQHELVLRSDADTRHERDFLLHIARRYADPRVGCVGGSLRFRNLDHSGVARSEGAYWKFEMFLRKAESDAGILSTLSGPALSFRRRLFEPLESRVGEDVVIPKLAVRKGYRVVHEPRAVASEVLPSSLASEFEARRRMVVQGLPALFSRGGWLNPLKHPGHWLAVMSHKLLRWCTPLFMLGSLAGSLAMRRGAVSLLATTGQALIYASALVGYMLERRGRPVTLLSAACGFCVANAGFLVGLLQAATGRRVLTFRSE